MFPGKIRLNYSMWFLLVRLRACGLAAPGGLSSASCYLGGWWLPDGQIRFHAQPHLREPSASPSSVKARGRPYPHSPTGGVLFPTPLAGSPAFPPMSAAPCSVTSAGPWPCGPWPCTPVAPAPAPLRPGLSTAVLLHLVQQHISWPPLALPPPPPPLRGPSPPRTRALLSLACGPLPFSARRLQLSARVPDACPCPPAPLVQMSPP